MPDLLGHFDDLTDILLSVDPRASVLRDRQIDERDNQYGTLSLALRYRDGSRLYVELSADCSGDPIIWGDYGFQYLAPDGTVRFRYDNAPHYRGLPNFPHHLHLQTGVIRPDGPPAVRDLARAIRWHLEQPGEAWEPPSRHA
ncbi:MAG: toxin-antitoxin system TumE family protein [Dehalococcoidia bacterium]